MAPRLNFHAFDIQTQISSQTWPEPPTSSLYQASPTRTSSTSSTQEQSFVSVASSLPRASHESSISSEVEWEKDADRGPRLALGIDLGTVYSAVAFQVINGRASQDVTRHTGLIQFPHSDNHYNNSQMSMVCLLRPRTEATRGTSNALQGRDVENTPDSLYGWEAEDYVKSRELSRDVLLQYLKLAICGDVTMNRLVEEQVHGPGYEEIRKHIDSIKDEFPDSAKYCRSWELVSQMLGYLWSQAKTQLQHQVDKDCLQWPIDIVITRPSLYTVREDLLLIAAAEAAFEGCNIGYINVFNEATAAFGGMVQLRNEPVSGLGATRLWNSDLAKISIMDQDLEPGASVIIADIGGGTSDFSSLRVVGVQNKHGASRLDEIVAPRGGCFAAAAVTAAFLKQVDYIIAPLVLYSDPTKWPSMRAKIRKEFERFVCTYNAKSNGMHIFISELSTVFKRCPRVMHAGFQIQSDDVLYVSHQEVCRALDFSCDWILKSLSSQITATEAEAGRNIQAVVFIGGFSQNQYFEAKMRESLQSLVANVRFPRQPDKSMVARGAVQYAADRSLMREIILDMDIGIEMTIDDSEILPEHIRAQRVLDHFKPGNYVIHHVFHPLFKKGQRVRQDDITRQTGTRSLFPTDGSTIGIAEKLFFSLRRQSDIALTTDPENCIEELAVLETEIEDSLSYQWGAKHWSRSVESYWGVQSKWEGHWEGSRLLFALEIPASGHFNCSQDPTCPGSGYMGRCRGEDLAPWRKTVRYQLGAAINSEKRGYHQDPVEESQTTSLQALKPKVVHAIEDDDIRSRARKKAKASRSRKSTGNRRGTGGVSKPKLPPKPPAFRGYTHAQWEQQLAKSGAETSRRRNGRPSLIQ